MKDKLRQKEMKQQHLPTAVSPHFLTGTRMKTVALIHKDTRAPREGVCMQSVYKSRCFILRCAARVAMCKKAFWSDETHTLLFGTQNARDGKKAPNTHFSLWNIVIFRDALLKHGQEKWKELLIIKKKTRETVHLPGRPQPPLCF